ncbi:transcription elongation factor TFIIS-like [Argentina anserina]|uniref:transcription elongation factor TFIIS-like n=1 Tax=Argentina anserina TaxID=57926 RepID=UPI0021763CB0|nr:transcription elongation factor TFIIS-like [Potentilla anserina]
MEKELLEAFKDVTKASDAAKSGDCGAEESRCLEASDRLKNFPISYKLLVSTQVGKRLRNLTKHPRKKIQTFALGLMEVWKKIVIDETTKNNVKNGQHDRKDCPVKREASAPDSPRPQKIQKSGAVKMERVPRAEKFEKASSPENVNLEKVTGEVKKKHVSGPPKLTSMPKSNDQARDKVRGFLHEALSKVAQESGENERFAKLVNACDPIRVAVTVESVLFGSWGGSNGSQKHKYRSLIFNLRDQNNPDFRRKVLMGDIKAERLVDMSTAEMASDERQL